MGPDADQEEEESDHDVGGRLVQRLLPLERGRPAHDPRAEERHADPLWPDRAAVADEEADDEHERADEVEADSEAPVQRAAAEQGPGEGQCRRHGPDATEQDEEAAERRPQHAYAGPLTVSCLISSSV